MSKLRILAVNLCRLILALTFILSGYVKAIDPLGTQYKLKDYAAALHLAEYIPDWITLTGAIALAMTEFALGMFMLFAIQRRLVSKFTTAMMVVMTLITVWIFIANPVKDCGCFGDAIKLTNGETLLKNIVLLAAAIVTMLRPMDMGRLISKSNQWIVTNYSLIYIVCTSVYCLYALPTFDFRPYHIGANIKKGIEIPEGAEQPEFETTFILKKNGQTREFTLDNYPDSTWTFVDSKTVQTSEGYVPPIHDFSMEDMTTGDDMTDDVISSKGYTFLLVSPHLENANDSYFGNMNQLYDYAQAHKYRFYCLTASNAKAIDRWRDMTGAEYPFLFTDETTLKTIVRSNPGLLLLKDGVVIGKWSHNQLPQLDDESAPLDKLPEGKLSVTSLGKKICLSLLWFFLPLFILSLADRTWEWTRRFRKQKSATGQTDGSDSTDKDNNTPVADEG